MKKLYRATAAMGVSTVVAMGIGLVRAKFLAVTLGPSGLGIFSQAMTFFQSAEAICGLGISMGITKYVSEMWQKQDISGVRNTMSVAITMQALCFFVFFILTLIFSKTISQFVFSSSEYSWLLVLVSGGVLFSIFVTTMECTILGLARPGVFSKARILHYILGLALLILFVGTMKLRGGFLYLAFNYALGFVIITLFLFRILKTEAGLSFLRFVKKIRNVDFKFYAEKLFAYGAVVLLSSALTGLTILYVRSTLIRVSGVEANGFYQVVFALVGYYTPFFTNGIWGYLFPKLSGITNTRHFNLEINKAIRFILIFLIPSIAVLFLAKKALILVIFSKEFLPALEIFPVYLLASLFFMISYMLATALMAKKKLAAYFSIILSQYLLYALLFTVLVRQLGLMAVAISYLAMNTLASFALITYQIKKMNFVFTKQNIILFAAGLVFILFILFVPLEPVASLILKGILVVCWFLFAIGKREKALFRSFVRAR
ncbi:MAG: oligosaccharide flippase family protein [Omnitrophica bacterium]|nr:oligosaccharide flippase family protein [Candidatus Omnitrophota bacterium]